MSMAMRWRDSQSGEERSVTAPLSLIVTAFAGVEDVGATWTPQLRTDLNGPTVLVFFDLAYWKQRLGGSALAQVFRQIGAEVPDVEDPHLLKAFFNACQAVRKSDPDLVLAYHDRSDGSLFTTVAEMAFAGRVGVEVNLDAMHGVDGPVEARNLVFVAHGFESTSIHAIGKVLPDPKDQSFTVAETSFQMQSLREDPDCAAEEFAQIADETHIAGLKYELTFTPTASSPPFHRPKVAILREQGFRGLAACGGFSYGDVLGAGAGWAHAALLHGGARAAFAALFARDDAFALAVCNGCQFLSHMREVIPGAQSWPYFKANRSRRFEARVALVEVVDSTATQDSVSLRGIGGSRLPVAVAHGEGRAAFVQGALEAFDSQGLGAARYVDGAGQTNGIALMPHPERVVTLESNSWYPPGIKETCSRTPGSGVVEA
ncbi:Class I glutamine amidotransferase-like protein [Lactarius tabidus]